MLNDILLVIVELIYKLNQINEQYLNLFIYYLKMLGLSGGTNMRGLNEFISDIRACKDKESESKRV